MMIDITVQIPKIDIENPNRGEPGRDGIGIHYMGEINEYNELPLTAEEGDAYYWAGKLYIFKDDEFPAENKGIQYQGPQGPEGPQGPPGEIAGLSGIATTEEAIAGVVDNKAMTPLKTKEAIEQGTNVFTALNTFRANIAVSSGTTAGSQGQIILGNKPQSATVQANIISSTTGALNYIATENAGHYFRIGNNTASTSITTNDSETAILSHNAFEFARITNVGVAKWLGNANTATKLETARTINGVAFDGTKDITIYNTEGHLVFPNGAEFWIG